MSYIARRSSRLVSSLVLLCSLQGCVEPPLPVPTKLLGTWRTSAASHSDRYLQISYDQLTFGTIEPRVSELHALIGIEQTPDGRQFRLTYLDSGGSEHQLRVNYDDTNGGTLTFANQPGLVWFKQRGGA